MTADAHTHLHTDAEIRDIVDQGVAVINDLQNQVQFLKVSDLIGRRLLENILKPDESVSVSITKDDELHALLAGVNSEDIVLTITKIDGNLDLEIAYAR